MNLRLLETMESLNVGSLPLGEHDADWFKVMTAVSNSSLRVKVASVVSYYVRRRKPEYIEIVQYTANKHGLTFDECFHRLLKGESLGKVVEGFEVNPALETAISHGDAE